MTDRDTWRIPPPLHEKTMFFHLTIPEWVVLALVSLLFLGIVISVGSIQAVTYLAIPAALFVLLRRNETTFGYVSGLEMIARYLRYFYQFAAGRDTFILERSLPYEQQEKDAGDLE